ncbi:hypothetical protein P170DRAFT_508132 [Aspergillus steynii IBT 23096]|uniref:Integral membrane protein n=1 Tax=Aspergillus steynii IBT 23096 TaxID=1392250 RepID=A0A2I2GKX9_9EURO|nr:uncharacterized protein P170DRAFT_508132 [Aspergillus steynii IBT 23096]PLB53536.1 hypothetical protein P170DRAFT_508132 [Aspergillus steynii IBT 23096]
MAPRRGGGSSGGYSSGSSNQCSDYDAFATTFARIYIAFHALFFLVFVTVFFILVAKHKRTKRVAKAPLLWFCLYFSIIFSIISTALSIIFNTLSECGIFVGNDAYRASISIDWLGTTATLLVILAIMFPISQRLHHGNKGMGGLVRIAHSVTLGLFAILLIVSLSITTRVVDALYSSGYRYGLGSDIADLAIHQRRIWVACYAMGVICMLVAAATMLFALVRNPNFRRGSLRIGIPLLILSSLAMTLLDLGGYIHNTYGSFSSYRSTRYLEQSYEAQLFLRYFFYTCAFLSTLLVGSTADLHGSYAPRFDLQAPAPPMYQPRVH